MRFVAWPAKWTLRNMCRSIIPMFLCKKGINSKSLKPFNLRLIVRLSCESFLTQFLGFKCKPTGRLESQWPNFFTDLIFYVRLTRKVARRKEKNNTAIKGGLVYIHNCFGQSKKCKKSLVKSVQIWILLKKFKISFFIQRTEKGLSSWRKLYKKF